MSYQQTRPFLALKPVRTVNKRRLELLFRDGSNRQKKVFYGIECVGGSDHVYKMVYDSKDYIEKPEPGSFESKQSPKSCESKMFGCTEEVKEFLVKEFHATVNEADTDVDDTLEVELFDNKSIPLFKIEYKIDADRKQIPRDIKKWCNVFEALFID